MRGSASIRTEGDPKMSRFGKRIEYEQKRGENASNFRIYY